ncbi:transcriptional regulator [Nocardia sp. NPDC057030]|uniref:transcriptional regulator n=1 Tax=unclassified Nocardia TaxID=2637762 RepID=UPI00363B6FC5
MRTDKATVAGIREQLQPLDVRAGAMFGEGGRYCDDKLVADDRLFVEPTAVATRRADESRPAAPYPGAEDYYRVAAVRPADTAWLGEYVRRTAEVRRARISEPRKSPAKPR